MDITEKYQKNVQFADEQIKEHEGSVNFYSGIRLAIFLLFLVIIYVSVALSSFIAFAVALVILGVLFNWLVKQQNESAAQKNYYTAFKTVNQNEIDSITIYGNVYDKGTAYIDEKHYYISDLDIFGAGSLFNLMNRAATNLGCNKLAGWLIAAADKPSILSRQQAVAELKEKNDWKLELQSRLLFANKEDKDSLKKLFAYLHLPLNMPGERWLSKYIIIGPVLLFLFIALTIFSPVFSPGIIAMAILNLIIAGSRGDQTRKTDLISGKIGGTLKNYAEAFGTIEKEEWRSPLTASLAAKVKKGGHKSTSAIIRKLSMLITNLDARSNMILGPILNALFVWNIRFVIAIENWKRDNHEDIEIAFEVIAEFEALLSLSSLAINNPDWCTPQIAEGEGYTVTGKNMGHPLISQKNRVNNDYKLADAYHIDIITGSNMAGKSTFLRTIGINAVLALCGAPVCANSMEVSIITIISYMRIKDSLNESTSTFKAELDRLQMLLSAVATQPKVFFLVDEMLRGTNSIDKYKGSKAVIERLISKKGVGMVATHDLQIAELEQKYPDYIRNFYFDIQVKDGEMLFDYKIKDGECKTFNASLLLKQIGIDVDAEE